MKTILILDKVSLAVLSRYQDTAPNQSKYGGPWGDVNATVHVQVPDGVDGDCVLVAAIEEEVDEETGEILVPAGISITEDAVAKAAKTQKAVQEVVRKAQDFGNKLLQEFAAENIILGITADEMTGTVRKAMVEVISALSTGSLIDAMEEARAIPAEKKDPKYITDARLLSAINKIEAYLGMPLSTEL